MWLFQLFRGVWHRLNCGPLEMFLLYFVKDCLPFSSWLRLCGELSQLIVCLSKAFPLCYNDGKYRFSKWLRCIKSEKSLRQDKVGWVKSESKSFGYPQKMCSFPLQWNSHGEAISEWQKCHSMCTKDSKVWGCLSWKDAGYIMTDQAYMLIPVLGFQLVTESRWRPSRIVQPMVDQALRCPRDVPVGQPLLGIFLLVALFPAPANLFLAGLGVSVQGCQASKKTEAETRSRIQTLPKAGSST